MKKKHQSNGNQTSEFIREYMAKNSTPTIDLRH